MPRQPPKIRYPSDAENKLRDGQVAVEATVMPDRRARSPRIIMSVPRGVFDSAVKQGFARMKFDPAMEDGKPVPCTLMVMIRFEFAGAVISQQFVKQVDDVRRKAESGDVSMQFTYGMLLAGVPVLHAPRTDAVPWFLKAAQAGMPAAHGDDDAKLYLASMLAASPEPSSRDSARALDLVDQVKSKYEGDPIALEIRAAAAANLGDFWTAVDTQNEALKSARFLGWDVKPQKERLALYEAKQGWTGNLLDFAGAECGGENEYEIGAGLTAARRLVIRSASTHERGPRRCSARRAAQTPSRKSLSSG
jgi:TonB family protein